MNNLEAENTIIYSTIDKCRICGNKELEPVFGLGEQVLSGIFPERGKDNLPATPLELVKCDVHDSYDACGLLQLRHSADVGQMYGTTYGYYSSLSPTMVEHLAELLSKLGQFRTLREGDAVLDIGCNDGTLLKQIQTPNVKKVGIDPSSEKFRSKFDSQIMLVEDFFSESAIQNKIGNTKFNQITAIAMFYDLENPLEFLMDIESLLVADGIWAIELAYLPTMLKNLVYDQICHEHVTYPALTQIDWLVKRANLTILDVEFNNVNGGSFLVVGSVAQSDYSPNRQKIENILEYEKRFETLQPFQQFHERLLEHKQEVKSFLIDATAQGKTVVGYGASTKGNIVLNFCDIDSNHLLAIADANPEKWGRVTPGSGIPIISKDRMRELKPDYLFVLIWHFYEEVLIDEEDYVMEGGCIIFDLPRLHIVDIENYERRLKGGFEEFQFDLES